MTRPGVRTRYALRIGALLVLSALIFLPRSVDRFRPRLEAAASSAFGIRVRIGAPIRLGLGRGLLVRLKDVHVESGEGAVLVSVDEARLWVGALSLLRGSVRVRRIELAGLNLSVVRHSDGTTQLEGLRCPEALFVALGGASAAVSGANLTYADSTAGIRFAAYNVSLITGNLRLAHGARHFDPKGLGLVADLACDSLRSHGTCARALRVRLQAERGVFAMAPFALTVLGGRASGSLYADLNGAEPRYALRCSLRRFEVEQLLALQPDGPMVHGSMDFAAHLSLSGVTPDELLRTSAGSISLRGSNLTLVGDDLDRRLSRFESSQDFSLVDVGAAVLAGPVGLAVTRGYSIASLFRGSGGDSPIEGLSSDWLVQRGIARARDVAMSTRSHRIVLRGNLDFVRGRYVELTVAIVDADGCATAHQVMNGDFAHPAVQRPHLLTSIAGPVLHLYRQARAILPGSPCDSSYTGSVAPPE